LFFGGFFGDFWGIFWKVWGFLGIFGGEVMVRMIGLFWAGMLLGCFWDGKLDIFSAIFGYFLVVVVLDFLFWGIFGDFLFCFILLKLEEVGTKGSKLWCFYARNGCFKILSK